MVKVICVERGCRLHRYGNPPKYHLPVYASCNRSGLSAMLRWAVFATSAAAGLAGHCGEGPRPQVADILVNELFLGIDPMLEPVPDVGERIYPEMTSVTDKDVDMVLFSAAQPVTFWLELGSMVARCIKRNFGVQLS